MTETVPETTEAPEISEAWGALWKWVTSQRKRWDSPAVKLAMREAAGRGAGYHDVAIILWRLGWDPEARTHQVLGELSHLCRFGPGGDPDAYERGGQLWREAYANRNAATGSQPAFNETSTKENR